MKLGECRVLPSTLVALWRHLSTFLVSFSSLMFKTVAASLFLSALEMASSCMLFIIGPFQHSRAPVYEDCIRFIDMLLTQRTVFLFIWTVDRVWLEDWSPVSLWFTTFTSHRPMLSYEDLNPKTPLLHRHVLFSTRENNPLQTGSDLSKCSKLTIRSLSQTPLHAPVG